jgi:hypothetical protein
MDDRGWVGSIVDTVVHRVDTVRDRYGRWQRRRESFLGRALRRLRWAAQRTARPAARRDRISPLWTWAIVCGAVEAAGQLRWTTGLLPRSSDLTDLIAAAHRPVPGWLDGFATADPVSRWLLDHAGTGRSWLVTGFYPAALLACTVVTRRSRPLRPGAATLVRLVARLLGLATLATYVWHLLATRLVPLADAVAAMAPWITIGVVLATLAAVRVLAGSARRR